MSFAVMEIILAYQLILGNKIDITVPCDPLLLYPCLINSVETLLCVVFRQ